MPLHQNQDALYMRGIWVYNTGPRNGAIVSLLR